ncbi:MAG: ABC transporter permease [Bacteroidales bacterium]|nr:ABC transporter permease [Bacteroidales bacterium]MDD3201123.1 ABC transporter permease [Bacteroidales bacterium]
MKDFKVVSPLFRENFRVAVSSIMSNRLRSILTIMIIAIGVTSLVGIQTAINVLVNKVTEGFGQMGANSFTISSNYSFTQTSEHQRQINRRQLSYDQVRRFVGEYDKSAVKSISATALSFVEIKSSSDKTNPTSVVIASDENYLCLQSAGLELGRNFSEEDMATGAFVCLIGYNIRKTLFKESDPINKEVTVGAVKYRVIGAIKEQGSTFGVGVDDMVVLPITNARSIFLSDDTFYSIGVFPKETDDYQSAIDRATTLFRSIRRLSPADKSDFRVSRSDAIQKERDELQSQLSTAALVIGLITLLGAAVGLMNIMLVSVKERTREIGTRKTMGATAKTIEYQFFMEAVIIGQIGGILGSVMGIIIGNITAIVMDGNFSVPWKWLLISVLVCFAVSIVSGYIPAKRAAALNPIDALRYE